MYELSVACKYLIPRWRQLSSSIISLVSILVIALVVWLIVVFFSVKDGLENSWIDKLIALTAPVRLTPTEKYYNSYYYLSDSVSSASDYNLKSIGEKLESTNTDPYNPDIDEEIPSTWPEPVYDADGSLVDLVKKIADITQTIPGLIAPKISDYEMSVANVRLRLLRSGGNAQQFMEQASYLGSFDPNSKAIASAIQPLSTNDFQNLLHMLGVSNENVQEESPDIVLRLDQELLHSRLETYFSSVNITELKTPAQGWRLPKRLLPEKGRFLGLGVLNNATIISVIIPARKDALPELSRYLQENGTKVTPIDVVVENKKVFFNYSEGDKEAVTTHPPIFLAGNIRIPATPIESSFSQASKPTQVKFAISMRIQGINLQGEALLGSLEIAKAESKKADNAFFALKNDNAVGITMPTNSWLGEGILLPRSFKDGGALIGDSGFISYYSPTPSTIQEQRMPVYVAGFYDPGIIPVGGKYVLTSRELITAIRASQNQEDGHRSTGLNIHFDNIEEAPRVKHALTAALATQGLSSYWKIETYREYEFTKDIIQQLHSEKNLFSIISIIIILVACSNIISMLIILVNDKKIEIGILRSMGASSLSIAIIFGFCGIVMGTLGSIIGVIAALLTLHNLDFLVSWISHIQGHDLFNPMFFGNTLPNQISYDALALVIGATAMISLLAGIVPAIKASLLRPSAILRSE